MEMQELTPQDKDQWARSPGTVAFYEHLRETMEVTKERWVMGHFEGATTDETGKLNAVARAGVDVLRQVLDVIDDHRIKPVIGNEDEDDEYEYE